MGKVNRINPVKLVIGLIFKDDPAAKKIEVTLKKKFGPLDYESPELPFCFTGYYRQEFGEGLKKKFLSFARLVHPQELAKIKSFTNKLEGKFSKSSRRLVNIDPGYVDLAKYILATTKDYCHRIYLDQGIFAEITLSFKDDTFVPGEWTYRDYQTKEYIAILNKIRQLYSMQLKH